MTTTLTLSGRPVARADIDTLRALTEAWASPLSEYTAANLYLFRAVHDYRWTDLDGPALSGRTYDGVEHLTPLTPVSPERLADLARRLAPGEVIYPLTAEAAGSLETRVNPDDSDYVFAASDLAALDGAARKAKRNLRTQFRRDADPRDAPMGEATAAAALRVLDEWLADVEGDWAQTDYLACREAIDLQTALGLDGLITYTASGQPAGFLLASVVDATAVVHFAKGRRTFPGVYEHLFSRFAELAAGRFDHLNFEQDLGKPGFRQAKRAYGPVALLAKHRLTNNSNDPVRRRP